MRIENFFALLCLRWFSWWAMVDNNAKAWLDEVKDALFDAEDPLNVIDYEFFECEFEAEFESQTKVSNFFNTSLSSFNRQIELIKGDTNTSP